MIWDTNMDLSFGQVRTSGPDLRKSFLNFLCPGFCGSHVSDVWSSCWGALVAKLLGRTGRIWPGQETSQPSGDIKHDWLENLAGKWRFLFLARKITDIYMRSIFQKTMFDYRRVTSLCELDHTNSWFTSGNCVIFQSFGSLLEAIVLYVFLVHGLV